MKKHQNIVVLILVISLFFVSEISFTFRTVPLNLQKETEIFQESFHRKEKIASKFFEKVFVKLEQKGDDVIYDQEFISFTTGLYEKEKISLFIADKNTLHYWSNSDIPQSFSSLPSEIYGLDSNNNGYYYFIKQNYNDYDIWVYILIKKNYKYENRFLKNNFAPGFHLKNEHKLSCNPALGEPVYDSDGKFAFSIIPKENLEESKHWLINLVSLISAILALILLIYSISEFFRNKKIHVNIYIKYAAVLTSLFFIRAAIFIFKVPSVFYENKLFSPGVYASGLLLPSLGDLFLHVLFLTCFAYLFYKKSNKIDINSANKKTAGVLITFISTAVLIIFTMLIVYLVKTLVFNSQLQLNVNFINQINIFNITGLAIIGLLYFKLFFLSSAIFNIGYKLIKSAKLLFLIYFIVFALFVLLWKLIHHDISAYWIMLSLLPASILVYKTKEKFNEKDTFANMVLALFVFCLTITFALFSFYKSKEIDARKSLAITLSIEQDPIAEFLFSEIEEDLFHDKGLINLFAANPYDIKTLERYLRNKYFSGHWTKYDLQATVCSPNEKLMLRPANIEYDCFMFFQEYMEELGKETISENLVFLDNNTGRSSYLVKIPVDLVFVQPWEVNRYYLYLEFDSKFVPKDLGFPELFLDEGSEFPGHLNIYSYAVYKNGILINKFGKFFYSINSSVYGDFEEEFSLFDFGTYNHLYFNKDNETSLIVSKEKATILEKIAPFSYLFILYFLVLIVFLALTHDLKTLFYSRLNFRSRLQASMVIIVLISLLSIASVSSWFIYNIYSNNNKAFINEKAYSVLMELEHQMIEASLFEPGFEYYLDDVLLKLSNVFFTDINVYSPEGELVSSSRPKLFDEGIVSELMNPEAYFQLKGHKQILLIQNESIGNLQYLSAYLPLNDINNELIAYINLPYFTKYGELRSEISFFLVAFINIYLILLVLAIVLAFFISGYVTRPLQLLRNSISSIKLGAINRKIDWHRKDEIGQLVQEYNRMIDELTTSADLLAQSERESAWREMAKQVAHEIKNPLTPMKLSVQYLEKAWKDKVENYDDRLNRFVVSMIEQIDSLSEIASAFSDFAKMPAGKFENIDLEEFIREVSALYKDFEKVKINIKPSSKRMIVYVDKKQMLRLFNNVIKNAVQAYDKDRIARIDIILYEENKSNCIEVKDYGQGIPEELKKNIFQPYFTTKTGGLGLGLAMVKSIAEGFGGAVGFNSTKGEGSSFFIKLPKAK